MPTRLITLLFLSLVAHADERLADRACRSVHLQYTAAPAVAFYNEITVEASAPGTYFAVCGWDKGYYGIQELASGKKLLIFSVWDSDQNDPKAVGDDRRVKLLHRDPKVRIGRFGGEGTGGQSFFDYDWKTGETYRFLVTAKPNGDRTEYAGWFFDPEGKTWKHLVTFSTITGGRPLGGYYSFVEDFKRDGDSFTRARVARFGNGWTRTTDGAWSPIPRTRFTADSNPAANIDASVVEHRFRLATGGETKNTCIPLGKSLETPETPDARVPADVEALFAAATPIP